jgi:hypothetical protein
MKVVYLVEVDADPMQTLDIGANVEDIRNAVWEQFPQLPKTAIRVDVPLDPWYSMGEGNKNELIKLVHKSIRHGFGDHPEMLTDMNALATSIAKRLAGELWARSNLKRNGGG